MLYEFPDLVCLSPFAMKFEMDSSLSPIPEKNQFTYEIYCIKSIFSLYYQVLRLIFIM